MLIQFFCSFSKKILKKNISNSSKSYSSSNLKFKSLMFFLIFLSGTLNNFASIRIFAPSIFSAFPKIKINNNLPYKWKNSRVWEESQAAVYTRIRNISFFLNNNNKIIKKIIIIIIFLFFQIIFFFCIEVVLFNFFF